MKTYIMWLEMWFVHEIMTYGHINNFNVETVQLLYTLTRSYRKYKQIKALIHSLRVNTSLDMK